MLTIALIGNPNCGKTSLFNALTGDTQQIGNWPGVTVERKSGTLLLNQQSYEIVDLPGIYSLNSTTHESAMDERITQEFLQTKQADLLVNVLDASNLERHLYLTSQLLEMRIPMIVAVNMLDIAIKRGLQLDLIELAKQLGCPVVGLELRSKKNLNQLYAALTAPIMPENYHPPRYPKEINTLIEMLPGYQPWQAIPPLVQATLKSDKLIDYPLLIADVRYSFANQIALKVIQQQSSKTNFSILLDHIALNRILGIPLFLAAMYLLFTFAINIGGIAQVFLDTFSRLLLIQGSQQLWMHFHLPKFIGIIVQGIGLGINTLVSFIPVLWCMFFGLAFLEDSGYMARAALVLDRLMRFLGLPGQAFIPLLIGFGCNVPAIMAIRTLTSHRDRILTAMMVPFMSCGARLAIFAAFTALFFPTLKATVVFALYLLGISMAILTGLSLQHTLLQGKSSPLIMELPPYHVPQFKNLSKQAGLRLRHFMLRSIKLIIPVCIIISAFNTVTIQKISLLAILGQTITPLFSPMGIQMDNWPATVGLLTGILAKEVVIATLNTLYTQIQNNAFLLDVWSFKAILSHSLQAAIEQFRGLAFTHPLSSAKLQNFAPFVAQNISRFFVKPSSVLAYLTFSLLYFPCVSTVATLSQELKRFWAWFSVCWSTCWAYGIAVILYQGATWQEHPLTSSLWISAMLILFSLFIILLRFFSNLKQDFNAKRLKAYAIN